MRAARKADAKQKLLNSQNPNNLVGIENNLWLSRVSPNHVNSLAQHRARDVILLPQNNFAGTGGWATVKHPPLLAWPRGSYLRKALAAAGLFAMP